MKVVEINSTCGVGSTGRICVGIKKAFEKSSEDEEYILFFWGKDNPNGIRCSNMIYEKFQALFSRITGLYGLISNLNTHRVIREIKRIKPDLVHLHNVHDHTVNICKLVDFLANNEIKVLWTFHDCWAFTAYCAHFSFCGCGKWQTQCKECVLNKKYSWFLDKSSYLFRAKKDSFEACDFRIVAPSQWLANLVKKSYLKDKEISVINNGVDLNVFYPRGNKIKRSLGIENKHVILGVAYDWGLRKGIDVFIKLASDLDDNYQIIVIGTNDLVDKELPSNIISIHRTENQQELAEFYSCADVFANPTREEVFGLVNIEALACGTPVVVFNTGGCPECLDDKSGIVVEYDNYEMFKESIIKVIETGCFVAEDCINRAKLFDETKMYEKYVSLYKKMVMSNVND